MEFEWSLSVSLIVSTLFGIVGYLISHKLSAARDERNKQRDVRIEYLVKAFRASLDLYAYGDPKTRPKEIARNAAIAISDVQIFGTTRQIEFFTEFTKNWDAMALAKALQDELRRELELPKSEAQLQWLRFDK